MRRSKTSRRSAIAGDSRNSRRAFTFREWLLSSLTAKIVLLAVMLVVLPLLLYAQFDHADRKARLLVAGALQRQSWLIAQGLRPLLDAPDGMPSNLNPVLARFDGDGTALKLMLAPSSGNGDFFYVAAQPRIEPARLEAELAALNRNGVLPQLARSCADETVAQIRNGLPGAADERLTSIIPIRNRWGCWVLVSSHTASELAETSIAEPYWKLPPVRLAILIYVVMALLGVVFTWSALRGVRHFRRVAYAVRQGRAHERSFSSQNRIPELAPVAADFDELVQELHRVAQDIRRKAEDNAHALKTPLATIRASLSPLRAVAGDERGRRAISLIESSVVRLGALITEGQHLDRVTADAMDRRHGGVDLNEQVMRCISAFQERAVVGGVTLCPRLEPGAIVPGSEEGVKVVLENILENALSFSPPGSTIELILTVLDSEVQLDISDQGVGVRPGDLPHIFDRHFSRRPDAPRSDDAETLHSGLGLWIVRENVEAMGGRVIAANNLARGFRVSVILPHEKPAD